MPSIFLTGATGYIGGSVLSRLLKEHDSKTITVLVRSEAKAAALKTVGVNTVVGSYKDLELLAGLSSKADVVLAIADCDDVPAAQAILHGLKETYKRTGVPPVLIHTSGTGVLVDDSYGSKGTDVVYSDLDIPLIESLPLTQIHRPVDVAIASAGQEGWVKTHIILPPVAYGVASGVVADTGVQNLRGMVTPLLAKIALERGQVGVVGLGKNVWPSVDVDELADLYMLLLNAILSKKPGVANGREGYYFADNGEFTFIELAAEVGRVLHEFGEVSIAEVKSFTEEEKAKFYQGHAKIAGGSCRTDSSRSKALGWKPVKTDILENVREEVEFAISEKKAKN